MKYRSTGIVLASIALTFRGTYKQLTERVYHFAACAPLRIVHKGQFLLVIDALGRATVLLERNNSQNSYYRDFKCKGTHL